MSESALHVRRATAADAALCGPILFEAFAGINRSHNFPLEITEAKSALSILETLFSHPGFYSVVAEADGRIVGSNCLDERSPIRGVGPLSVDAEFQDRGAGRALMCAVLERAREQNSVGVRLLQSSFHGRSLALYAKLGFDVREPVCLMAGLPNGIAIEGVAVRPAALADLEHCNRLCEHVHGHRRTSELEESIERSSAMVTERQGRITGYAAGFGYFGHASAETNLDLEALLSTAKEVGGPGILVPARNAELFRWCLERRMRVVQVMTLMTIGLYNEPRGAYLPSVLY